MAAEIGGYCPSERMSDGGGPKRHLPNDRLERVESVKSIAVANHGKGGPELGIKSGPKYEDGISQQ